MMTEHWQSTVIMADGLPTAVLLEPPTPLFHPEDILDPDIFPMSDEDQEEMEAMDAWLELLATIDEVRRCSAPSSRRQFPGPGLFVSAISAVQSCLRAAFWLPRVTRADHNVVQLEEGEAEWRNRTSTALRSMTSRRATKRAQNKSQEIERAKVFHALTKMDKLAKADQRTMLKVGCIIVRFWCTTPQLSK